MSLSLALDYAAQIVKEPGYGLRIPSEDLAPKLNPTAGTLKGFWRDEWTKTIMLQPLQLQEGFLNSADQLDSIIGLTDRGSGKLVVDPANIGSSALFEANVRQNANNPWVFYSPIPGTTLSFLETLAFTGMLAYLHDHSPFPVSTTDPRVIASTEEKISGNQALYFRYFQPDSLIGHSYLGISIGEFNVVLANDLVAIFQDVSPGRDRTQYKRILTGPLFSPGSTDQTANHGYVGTSAASETGPGDRSIFWLPFHRSLVYIQVSTGKWTILDTRQIPMLNGKSGDNRDWDIVEDREVMIWGYTPSVGRFQLQKVKWFAAATLKLPTFTLDYTPASALTADNIVPDADTGHGTLLTWGAPTTPAGYANIENSLDTCPPVTTDSTDQTKTYGEQFTFTASGDQRFTPFLYAVEVRVPREVRTWPVSPTTLADAHPAGGIINSATIRASVTEPADTSFTAATIDRPPFFFPALWFRSAYPVQLAETVGPLTLFTGITTPTQVMPLRNDANIHRDVTITGASYWKRLATTQIRDLRDWTGTGHIRAVDYIVRQCGIDTTGADYPLDGLGSGIGGGWDIPLGGLPTTFPNTGALRPHWRPKPEEYADHFISRIAEQFAGFVVGFYPNGTFYYLPAANGWYYNTTEVTFFKSRTAHPAGPCYESPVEFENVELEANAVQVVARSQTGGLLRSSVFVDWASIKNPAAPNFVGEWRGKVYRVDGVLTCNEVNRIAHTIFMQLRRRHLKVRFHADYVPTLKPGRVFTLEGQGSDTYRLISYTAAIMRAGIHKADMEAELVENGFI